MRLNPEIKARWIKALRSGEYKQGTAALCRLSSVKGGQEEYCCLGVFADIQNAEKVLTKNNELGQAMGFRFGDEFRTGPERSDQSEILYGFLNPYWFAQFFNAGPEYDYLDRDELINLAQPAMENIQSALSKMNDTYYSFDEIADWIEENL